MASLAPREPMCGRYALTTPLERLLPRLEGALPAGLREHYAPRPEVFPGEPVLLLRREQGHTGAGLALWGLLPSWVKDPSQARRSIHARSETVAEKPSFRSAWRHHRCLLPANAFFEWQRPGGGRGPGRRWRIERRDQSPFWLAGLWERWLGADGSDVDTCCVLTTAPNALLAPIHNRMPVVIPDGLEEPWLADVDGAGLRALEPLMAAWDPTGWQAVPEPAG